MENDYTEKLKQSLEQILSLQYSVGLEQAEAARDLMEAIKQEIIDVRTDPKSLQHKKHLPVLIKAHIELWQSAKETLYESIGLKDLCENIPTTNFDVD